jgi:hypothetical protein
VGDNGNTPDSIVPLPAEQSEDLTETYYRESDMVLLRRSVVKGWLEASTPRYQAVMRYLDQVVRGERPATPSVRVRACGVVLDSSRHVAEQINPSGTAAQVAQAQQVTVNVNPDPDSPIAKMRAMWAEREGDGQ